MENPLLDKSAPKISSFHEELIQFLAGAAPLEQKLLSTFPKREFPLRMLRGLPRLYDKDDPRKVRLKEGFSHLPSLKKLAMQKFLLPLYGDIDIPRQVNITLLNYVRPGHYDDFALAKETMRLLKGDFPHLKIEWVAIVPRSLKIPHDSSISFFLEYDQEYPAILMPNEAIDLFSKSLLILEIPTVYPGGEELERLVSEKRGAIRKPRILKVGSYGCVESRDFNPESGNLSMGLHFLEQGIMIPEHATMCNMFDNKKFYFADLATKTGGAIYLHALLQKEIASPDDILVCTPDMQWLLAFIAEQNEKGKPFLEGSFGVKQIEIHDQGTVYTHQLQDAGKTLCIVYPGPLRDRDLSGLMSASENFVGLRSDALFSQAVAQKKVFFYDSARTSLLKDIVALAKNGIAEHKGACRMLRTMRQLPVHRTSLKQWVDELYFQERKPWPVLAKEIGLALQDRSIETGFKALFAIIERDYAFNRTLNLIVRREMAHFFLDGLEELEKHLLNALGEGHISANECWMSIKDKLSKKS